MNDPASKSGTQDIVVDEIFRMRRRRSGRR